MQNVASLTVALCTLCNCPSCLSLWRKTAQALAFEKVSEKKKGRVAETRPRGLNSLPYTSRESCSQFSRTSTLRQGHGRKEDGSTTKRNPSGFPPQAA